MLLLEYKLDVLVLIIGHKDPDFLLDTAESIKRYNQGRYDIAFAIDGNIDTYNALVKATDKKHVYKTNRKNGWGRGVLRTIVHAIDYFRQVLPFRHLITMDSDALCVGPFIKEMVNAIEDNVFFVGAIWWTTDPGNHFRLRNYFLPHYQFDFHAEMTGGPCMLWSSRCLDFCRSCGLLSGFDKIYPHIDFPHDQISTYLNSCGCGTIKDVSYLMDLRFREPLPTFHATGYGKIPIARPGIGVIHPVASELYKEDKVREYFRRTRFF